MDYRRMGRVESDFADHPGDGPHVRPNLLVILVLWAFCATGWGQQPKRPDNKQASVMTGRLGHVSEWKEVACDECPPNTPEFSTYVTIEKFRWSLPLKETHEFCGGLQKRLDPYLLKLVRIEYRRDPSYPCAEFVRIDLLKEPPKEKSNAPTTPARGEEVIPARGRL